MTLPLAGAPILADDLADIFPTNTDAWEPYTPTWTSSGTAPAIGNGSLGGAYMKVGRLVFWRVAMTIGTTSTIGTGVYTWSLPPFAATPMAGYANGRATIVDQSAGARFNRDVLLTGTGFNLVSEAGAVVTSGVPMTWASTDFMLASGFYEATS